MKNLLNLIFFCFIFPFCLNAQAPFISTWNTAITGETNNDQIKIPTTGTGYNYNVYWEDINNSSVNGQFNNVQGNLTITFPAVGIYKIEIDGDFPRIYFNDEGDKLKITNISQWGGNSWDSFENAFKGCSNLNVTATDTLTLPSNCRAMFRGCFANAGNSAFANWNTDNLTNMAEMFYGNQNFNQNINSWNVSNVTNMDICFASCGNFNQNLNSWDVSNVTSMISMFSHAANFNGNISDWNVEKVTDMGYMFYNCPVFNQNIGNWDVGNVKNMSSMFGNADNFNQNIGNWNTENVESTSGMFWGATNFNQDIGNWNMEKDTTMTLMFAFATNFNQDIGNWNVSNVKHFNGTFLYATNFNQNIGNWNVGNAIIMVGCFVNATSFNQDIGNWNVGNVIDMNSMFGNAISFNQDIGNWDVSKVQSMRFMFSNATNFNQDISNWDVGNVRNMTAMFSSASNFNQNLGNWNITNIDTLEMNYNGMSNMFDNSGMSVCNMDNTLNGWSFQNVNSHIVLGLDNIYYSDSSLTARIILTNQNNWIIIGGQNIPTIDSISVQDITKCEPYDGSFSASFTNFLTNNEYYLNWNGSNTGSDTINSTFSINDLSNGNYQYQIAVDSICTVYSGQFTINSLVAIPEIDSAIVQDLSCFGDENGSIEIFTSGGIGGLNYQWIFDGDTISNQQNIDSLSAGNYFVIVTDNASCNTSSQFSINQPNELFINHIVVSDSITATVNGGTTPYEYSWIQNDSVFSTDNEVFGLENGVYTLIVKDANGCTISQNITITGVSSNYYLENENDFVIYPNPTNDLIKIISNKKDRNYQYQVVDFAGKKLLEISNANSENEITIDLNNLEQGVYFLRIFNHSELIQTSKIIKL